jgi:hypothetical protein
MTPKQLEQHIIDNFLPKEKDLKDVRLDCIEDYCSGFNKSIKEVKALLPKIIEYIIKNKE